MEKVVFKRIMFTWAIPGFWGEDSTGEKHFLGEYMRLKNSFDTDDLDKAIHNPGLYILLKEPVTIFI